jgi:predicted HNH restriction endonuclease
MQDGGSIPPASTYRKGNMTEYKKCSKCSEEKPSTAEFFYRCKHVKSGLRADCKECSSTYGKLWRQNNPEHVIAWNQRLRGEEGYKERKRVYDRNRSRETKKQLIDHFGGKCTFCGYDKCLAAFDFHHINPEEKSFEVGRNILSKKFETLLKEAKKCVLLCANCHRELHDEKRS